MSKRRRSPTQRARTRAGAPAAASEPPRPSSPTKSTSTKGSAARKRPAGAARRSKASLSNWALPGLLGLAAIAVVVIFAVGGAGSSKAANADARRPVLGDPSATVVIQEFGDFQCPSCGAFARAIEPQIRAAYIVTGKVRLEWHDFPWIGQESLDAANAARCAGDQGKFWEFHDLLYQNQRGENQGSFSADRLKLFGTSLGLEPVAFGACVDHGDYRGAVDADFSDVRSQGFNGTPTFLIGSHRIVGAQSFEIFQAAIDAELASS